MATFERVSVQRSFFRFPDGLNFGLLELFLGAWFKNVESSPDNVEPSFNNVEPSLNNVKPNRPFQSQRSLYERFLEAWFCECGAHPRQREA